MVFVVILSGKLVATDFVKSVLGSVDKTTLPRSFREFFRKRRKKKDDEFRIQPSEIVKKLTRPSKDIEDTLHC